MPPRIPAPKVKRTNAQMTWSGSGLRTPDPFSTTMITVIAQALPAMYNKIAVPGLGERLRPLIPEMLKELWSLLLHTEPLKQQLRIKLGN